MKKYLEIDENHPATQMAYRWVVLNAKAEMMEAMASAALAGDRTCAICLDTLERIKREETVGERYLLGLAWYMKEVLLLAGGEASIWDYEKKPAL